MGTREAIAAAWPLTAAVCAAILMVATPAAGAEAAGVDVPDVAGVSVPDVKVPDVPGVQVPDLPDVGSQVDEVVKGVPPVDDVLPDLGGGSSEPQPADPVPETPQAEPPPDDGGGDPGGSPGTGAEVPGSAGTSNGGQAAGGGGRGRNGSSSSARGDPATGGRPGNGGADAGSNDVVIQKAAAESGFSNRIGELIAALPAGVLIGLIGLAVVALLMTGRSAWFARASRHLTLQRRSLQADVGALQAALVPDLSPSVGGVAVAVAYRPAAGPAAGGDFHDVFDLGDGRIGMVVGDVAGHGREALPRTAVVRYTIRAYLEAGLEPRLAIRLADRALSETFDGDFASAIAATYEPSTRRLVYSCAGHPQPIVVGCDPPSEVDVLASPPIGIGFPSGSRQTTFALEPGCEFWLFSDGLIEAHHEGEMLGRDGLRDLLQRRPDPADLLNELPGENDDGRDDLTACRLRPPETGDSPQPFSVEALLVEHTYDEEEIAEFLEACGLSAEEVEAACERVAAERRLEGQVLVRVSRLDSVLHWRVERVDPHLGRAAPPVSTVESPLSR